MIAAVVAFLRALAAYWQLRAVRYSHDLIEQSRDRIERLQDELEEQRNIGTVSSSDIADRLRNRITAEKKHLEYLSDSNHETSSRDTGAD